MSAGKWVTIFLGSPQPLYENADIVPRLGHNATYRIPSSSYFIHHSTLIASPLKTSLNNTLKITSGRYNLVNLLAEIVATRYFL
jgi:hypothetical protein